MQNPMILGALIGLVGAVGNNGKTADTDRLVMEALLSSDEEDMVEKIHKEKYRISPGCAGCKTPCGNTPDYDASRFEKLAPELLAVKEKTYDAIIEMVKELKAKEKTELPDIIYKAITYIGSDLEQTAYESLLEEISAY